LVVAALAGSAVVFLSVAALARLVKPVNKRSMARIVAAEPLLTALRRSGVIIESSFLL
jgi:hypothetical protein